MSENQGKSHDDGVTQLIRLHSWRTWIDEVSGWTHLKVIPSGNVTTQQCLLKEETSEHWHSSTLPFIFDYLLV